MTRGQLALVGGLAIVVVLIWAAVARLVVPAIADAEATPPPVPGAAASLDAGVDATATPIPSRSATPSPTEAPSDPPVRTDAPAPTEEPASTAEPDPTANPATAYAAFVTRLIDDQAKVAAFNRRLLPAAESGDQDTVRSTAVDILRFADGERDWLLANPPADCYADAHAAAGAMLEAYATVAERAIDWVDAAGLEALEAFGRVVAAGEDAQAALAILRDALEDVTCLAF